MRLRCENSYAKHSREITKCIVVNDMAGLKVSVDGDAFRYSQRMFAIDQNYYPETLSKLFIINAPIFFSVIWAIVKVSYVIVDQYL